MTLKKIHQGYTFIGNSLKKYHKRYTFIDEFLKIYNRRYIKIDSFREFSQKGTSKQATFRDALFNMALKKKKGKKGRLKKRHFGSYACNRESIAAKPINGHIQPGSGF